MNNKQQPKETMTIKSILPKDELKKYNEFCYNSKNTIIPKDELKAYNKFCYNSKNNCLTLTPTSEPINIRGLRTDANWSITGTNYDVKNNITREVNCIFWTKKEALNFLKTGKHICSITKEKLYQII